MSGGQYDAAEMIQTIGSGRMTPEQKASRARDRMLGKAREFQLGTYSSKFVAPVFQRMIRAEAAAKPAGEVVAIVGGEPGLIFREVGQCVCVTCGVVGNWKGDSVGGGTIESGHFLASRRMSILFEETNVHPQCKSCNQHLGGNQGVYEIWMRNVYGLEEIDRLRKLKNQTVQFSREALVDMRLSFAARLKAAEEYLDLTPAQEGTAR